MVKAVLVSVLAILTVAVVPVSAQSDIRYQEVRFEKGSSGTILTDRISSFQVVKYQLRARAGQVMVVDFAPANLSAHFDVLPPGSSKFAMFVGSESGNHFSSLLPTDGVYTLRVYLTGDAVKRYEPAEYTLDVKIMGGADNSDETPFNRTFTLQGVSFQVMSANNSSLNNLLIVPTGLEIDNSPILKEIEGVVSGAEVADLNGDGSPEVYVYVTSAGSGSYGSLVAYSANRNKSLSAIYLPPLMDDSKAKKGYMGHDQFSVTGSTLVRRFPVYRQSDTNANPTGGVRELQYKLIPGEAGWILKLDKVVEK